MSLFQKYKLAEKIYHDSHYTLYRGVSSSEANSVLIKTVHPRLPRLTGMYWLKNEYQILSKANIPGTIIPFSLERYQNNHALVLEYFSGQNLASFCSGRNLTIDLFLEIAIQLANILSELSSSHIIHRNIQPNSIFIEPRTLKVQLTNFIISSKENEPVNLDLRESEAVNIGYISPEQTGRMKISVDRRTDFYSLGIVFYQLLTGELPFQTDNSLEIIHYHLAQTPILPHQLNPGIPEMISRIVMKLLTKNPEDRYQSASGIKADLSICKVQYQQRGAIEPFSLGKPEEHSRFKISQELYGRFKEIETLQSFSKRIFTDRSTGVVVVKGDAGLGKTVLVERAIRPIVSQKGYFVSGKYEKLTSTTPYSAIISAFGSLIRQLLTESPAQLEIWRDRVMFALGSNGKVITEILPEIELIVGPQPDIPKLPAKETHNRFKTVFISFIRVFTRLEHPLILFLDDLQWCDLDSLKLLQHLLNNSDAKHLLIVIAYRDNEIDEKNIIATFDNKKSNFSVKYLQLQPFSLEDVNNLLVDTLHCSASNSTALAELLHKRTQGNPFFLDLLLQNLYQEKLLYFDFDRRQWQWDIKKICATEIGNYDVLDLIIENIKRLPDWIQNIIKIAACTGNQFETSILATFTKENQSRVANALEYAVQTGLIIQVDERRSYFQFVHSRIQQAVYDLLSEKEKEHLHLKIGQVLLQQTSKAELEPKIFKLVNHWNIARRLVLASNNSLSLIKLNLIAGEKAKISTAYDLAADHLNIAIESLPSTAWQDNYNLVSEVYFEAAEVQYLCTNFTKAQQLIQIILDRVKSVLEKVRAYQIQIHAQIAQNQMDKAVDTGLHVLRLLKVADEDYASSAIQSEQRLLSTHEDIQVLKALPQMVDPEKLAAMEILTIIVPPIYIVRPELFSPIVSKMIEICHQFGNSQFSAFAYSVYGLILCAVGNIDAGYELGLLGLTLQSQFDAREIKSKVDFTFNTMIRHWREPAIATLEHFVSGIRSGIEVGDIEYACFHAKYYCTYIFFVGESLPTAAQKSQKQIEMIQSFKQDFQLNYARIWLQLNLNLQGLASDRLLLVGESFDEVRMLPLWLETANATSLFALYLAKLILCYLLKDYKQAVVNGEKAEQYLDAARGTMCFSAYYFYHSLAVLALCDGKSQSAFNSKRLTIAKSYQQQIKLWEIHSPDNYRHKNALLSAEIARISGEYQQAEEYYDLAITAATKAGYHHEAALASELAGDFYLSINRQKIAGLYLSDAYYEYKKWGAFTKVQNLKSKYGKLLFENSSIRPESCAINAAESESRIAFFAPHNELLSQEDYLASLDLLSIIKASQAISSEIILDNLLSKMMEIILENAGAQKSILLLQQNSLLIVAAYATISPTKKTELPSVPLSQYSTIPKSIINYVNRTHKTVISERDNPEDLFNKDPYIIEHKPKSMLCLPIIYKNNLQGIIYLENRLIQGAFTPQKLSILQVILSQVSISIENARLYENLGNHASVQKSLKQKEILLKEIHHRVKNNLLVVSSLLDLQTSYTSEPEVIKLLDNCQNRITSMALVHQHLYGNSELDRIDFSQYIKSLLANLSYAQSCEERNINLHLDLEPIELNIETANPCGLIINELVSNALEHGFCDRNSGNIWIQLKHKTENQISLIIRDDGVGFKQDLDLHNSDSLGLELVCTLVEQIEGAITLAKTDGTKIEIVFDELAYQSRI